MLSKDQDLEVYRYYIGEVVPGKMYRSILPTRKDDNPSFGLFESAYIDRIRWMDFAFSGSGAYGIDLIRVMEGCSAEAAREFYYKNIRGQKVIRYIKSVSKTYPVIYYRKDHYLDYEIRYWQDRYTEEAELKSEKIYGINSMLVDGRVIYNTSEQDPAFYYDFETGWKVYRPRAGKKDKWKSKDIAKVIEGWHSIPRIYDSLIIASST